MKTKIILSTLPLLAMAFSLNAQVTFIVVSIPEYTPPEDTIYLNLTRSVFLKNDPQLALHKTGDNRWEITVTRPEGCLNASFRYYFSRGSLKTIEANSKDLAIAHPSVYWTPSRTIIVRIDNWYDRPGKPSTTSWNVSRISEDFPMPQLGRTRGISVYLPPDYNSSEDSYPVVYGHDGQEFFDLYSSYTEPCEVGLDEVLNQMASEGY